jgi:hypothetical protein
MINFRGNGRAHMATLFLGMSLLAACGDDGSAEGGGPAGGGPAGGSEQGGAADGGAPMGGASAGDSFELDIAAEESATVGCATYVDGVWGVGTTAFNEIGEVANLDCALAAVIVEGEPTPYWITSQRFTGFVGTDFDLRHSFSTAEAVIAVGSTSVELQDWDFETLFTGTIETLALDADSVEIRVK